MNRRRFFGGVAALCASPTLPAAKQTFAMPHTFNVTVTAGASIQSARQTIVGERGAELIVMPRAARVIPLNMSYWDPDGFHHVPSKGAE